MREDEFTPRNIYLDWGKCYLITKEDRKGQSSILNGGKREKQSIEVRKIASTKLKRKLTTKTRLTNDL